MRVGVLSLCDGPDWAGSHNAPACAGASSADPDVSPGSTNRVVRRPHQREPGHLNCQASRYGMRKAIERGEDERKKIEEMAEEDEDGSATTDGSGGPRDHTEPSVPLEFGRREKTRKSAVPIGDEESRLWGAERDYPPRFRRSVAESGMWTWPEQG
ncbi:hypothetical protein NDU88_002569 [Pleurodeles waltl]|uniref:Uncharacterized protein n=1 Tax=Pleurodeles waltl TaxID=8319 RepID=A0AAV7T3N4_PLEWA|nr:hypothetical protein NDU88_002569 [Pleurodeles waltl]